MASEGGDTDVGYGSSQFDEGREALRIGTIEMAGVAVEGVRKRQREGYMQAHAM